MPSAKPAHTVPVLGNALRVFAAVAQSRGELTTRALAENLGLPTSTCYRILQTFVAEGWLRLSPGGGVDLAFGLVPLLERLRPQELLIEWVRAPLARLAQRTGLTAKLSVRQGDEAVTIYCAPSTRLTALTSHVGATSSLAIGSSGAALLAASPDAEVEALLARAPAGAWKFQTPADCWRRVREARATGGCFDGGSYQPHVHTVSAVLPPHDGVAPAALTILGFPEDLATAGHAAMRRNLLACVTQIVQSRPSDARAA